MVDVTLETSWLMGKSQRSRFFRGAAIAFLFGAFALWGRQHVLAAYPDD